MTEDALIRDVLTRVKTIALVGWSPKPDRPSHRVAAYLTAQGYRVILVNPGQVGEIVAGEAVRASLAEIEGGFDMVDIFRRSDAVPSNMDQALERWPDLQTFWMQIGVKHPEAAAKGEARGVTVIQDRCPKIEYQRLFGELRMCGFNTGVISSRL